MISGLSTRLLNICISSFCKARNLEKAEALIIVGIRLGYLPDVVTYNLHIASFSLDVITYNTLIAGATKKKLISRTLDLFHVMLETEIVLDAWSYSSMIHCYFKVGRSDDAYQIIQDLFSRNIAPTLTAYNTVINGLCKAGDIGDALRLFRKLDGLGCPQELIRYNILIDGLCRCGKIHEAKRVLQELGKMGYTPNAITFTTVITCCFRSGKANANVGFELFSEMKHKGYNIDGDAFADCTMISDISKLGMTEEAYACTDRMLGCGAPIDIVSYNSMMNSYCKEGTWSQLFSFDEYTHTMRIDRLCKIGDIRGWRSSIVARNCLIHGLFKAGRVDLAIKRFSEMKVKDCYTYTSGVKVLRSARCAVLAGFRKESRKLKSGIYLVKGLHT
ncbi:hypothetical protein AMTRI_Chr01g129380 [Amborella trichopoda]